MVMNDKFGRKHSIMISAIPSTAGFLIMALARNWVQLFLGRLFTGVAAGIASSSIPVGTILALNNKFLCFFFLTLPK